MTTGRWNAGAQRWLFTIATIGCLCGASTGCERQSAPATTPGDTIRVSDAHMLEPPPGAAMGAAYLVLENLSQRDRELVLIETDVAAIAELHRTTYEDGVMRMRHVPHLVIPAGQSVRFEPGGYHVMLMQMEESLKAGASFELELTLDGAEQIRAQVEVRNIR